MIIKRCMNVSDKDWKYCTYKLTSRLHSLYKEAHVDVSEGEVVTLSIVRLGSEKNTQNVTVEQQP